MRPGQQLEFEFRGQRVRVTLPASAADEELLYLDPVICVTRRGGSADVWVRPAAQRASARADALEA